jgi:hypothetical protein
MVTKLQTDTALEATKSSHAYDMAIRAIAEGKVWEFEICWSRGSTLEVWLVDVRFIPVVLL